MLQFRAVVPLLLLGCFFLASDASAATITLDAVNRGYFRSDGYHNAPVKNTYTGHASTPRRYHSFFVFDLASLSGTVDNATLLLELEQYGGPYSTLTFDVYDVSATATELDTTFAASDTTGIAIYNDLGSGDIYATDTVSAADVGSVLNLPLSVLAQATIQTQLGAAFAVGISVQGPNSGDYNLRFGENENLVPIQLEIELTPPVTPPVTPPASLPIPEPGSLLLLSCLCGIFCRVSTSRRHRAA